MNEKDDTVKVNSRGALVIWHDMPADRSAEMLDWYNREHHAERVGIEGFLGVRRYHAVEAARALFIHYETENPEVLASDAYLARVNDPTTWSLKCQPAIRNNSRTVCSVERVAGDARGGFVVTAALHAGHDDQAAPFRTLATDIERFEGILAWEVLQGNGAASALPSAEKALRGAADDLVASVLIIHAMDLTSARKACNFVAEKGGTRFEVGIYQLAFALSKRDLHKISG